MNRKSFTRVIAMSAVVAASFLAPASAFADGPQKQHIDVLSYSFGDGSGLHADGGATTLKDFTIKRPTDYAGDNPYYVYKITDSTVGR